MNTTRMVAVMPYHNSGGWNPHPCLSLCEHMRSERLAVELHVPSSDPAGRRAFTRDAVPPWLKCVVYRLHSDLFLRRMLRRRFRQALAQADLVYLWAAIPEEFYEDTRAAGLPLCVERINCHRATAWPILEEAYRRAGLAPSHGITRASLAEERRKLAVADWIFAPSPLVERSLVAAGVPAAKILPTSYGCPLERIQAARPARPADAPFTVLFVGHDMIRKGAHLLLDAWAAAGIDGRLELCGQVPAALRQAAAQHLTRADVMMRGKVVNSARAYAQADVLALPTLEEGSPLVVYEAMAHGLAVLTSPMGASAVIRDGVDGLVRDPYDRDAWVSALRALASDPALRARLGAAARARVREFTWTEVGARRRDLLLGTLGARRQ
jgi:glycosyltransferase involved in cell wall biosynthesis